MKASIFQQVFVLTAVCAVSLLTQAGVTKVGSANYQASVASDKSSGSSSVSQPTIIDVSTKVAQAMAANFQGSHLYPDMCINHNTDYDLAKEINNRLPCAHLTIKELNDFSQKIYEKKRNYSEDGLVYSSENMCATLTELMDFVRARCDYETVKSVKASSVVVSSCYPSAGDQTKWSMNVQTLGRKIGNYMVFASYGECANHSEALQAQLRKNRGGSVSIYAGNQGYTWIE